MKLLKLPRLTAVLTATLCVALTVRAEDTSPDTPTHAEISAAMTAQLKISGDDYSQELQDAYRARHYAPVWVGAADYRARLQALHARVERADEDGLSRRPYRLAELPGPDATAGELAAAELQASRTFLAFVHELGATSPRAQAVIPSDLKRPPRPSASLVLNRVAVAADMPAYLDKLGPDNHFYAGLKKALAHFRGLRQAGGWPKVGRFKTLKPGMRHPRIPTLRERLFASGDLLVDELESDRYDDTLLEAVLRFQRRTGLGPDGQVGPKTRKQLNKSVDDRIAQIVTNMERARWLPAGLGDLDVIVNIPAFRLEVREDREMKLEMAVIVGRKRRTTPMLSSEMNIMEFHPYWGVPDSIARKDILPKLQEDPHYMQGLRIYDKGQGYPYTELGREAVDWATVSATEPFPYYFRQDPGPGNALGQMKFLFRNPFNVYLHDTPTQKLFARTSRAFSSGCVRLEKPLEMARYLLSAQKGWNEDRIKQTLDKGKNVRLNLSRPVGVHLVYQTVWWDEQEGVRFTPDLYGMDRRIASFVSQSRFKPAQDLSAQAVRVPHGLAGT